MSAERATAPTRSSIVAIGLWVYCAGLAVWLSSHWSGAATTTAITSWWVLPSQLAGIGVIGAKLARGGLQGARLAAWWALLVSIAVDAVATIGFGYLADTAADTYLTWDDALYICDYFLMTAVAALFFVACGGDFRRRRVWLDGATLAIGLIAAVVPFIVDPVITAEHHDLANIAVAAGYAAGIVVSATMTALLVTQVMNWRAELPVLLIVAGFAIALIGDVWVVAGDVRGENLQSGLANLIYCVYGALFATAAVLGPPRRAAVAMPQDGEGNVYGFVPVLAILLAIVIVLGTQARQTGRNLALTGILVLVGAVLLVARQLAVRHELRRLNRALAVRNADARLTELVRRSSDAIALVNAAGLISYLSPASETVLGAAPAERIGTRAALLLGADNEPRLEAFVRDLLSGRADVAELEIGLHTTSSPPRVLQVIGSDQSRNALIQGVVLTLRDVSAQRALEREVLEIATRERQRLCGDIHEGLGQQLTGVALLLRGASGASTRDVDELREALQPIIGHVNQAIESVQTLARGLSPLEVVRGSLASALEQLAAETRARTGLQVTLRNAVLGDPLTGVAADHLYRIAQDAVAATAARSSCARIEIALARDADRLTLSVSDDGAVAGAAGTAGDLGLRMIGYRARLLGGAVRIGNPATGAGRFEITIPLPGPPTTAGERPDSTG